MSPAEARLRDILGLKIPGKGRVDYSVMAGAGGGKTTMLSIRICAQILEGTPIEDFVVITYTNAAAAELREKITARLQRIINDGKAGAVHLEQARKALNSIELMQISTIHAFLLKILKEYAFESNVVLDVRMLEDEEDTARKEKFFNEWYHEHFSEIRTFSEDWIHETEKGRKIDKTEEVFRNMFYDLANVREKVISDVADHSEDLAKKAETYIDDWLPKLVLFKNTLLENRPVKKDGQPRKLNKDPQNIVDSIALVEGSHKREIDEAFKLSEAVNDIKKILDKGGSFYGAVGDNSPLIGVIPGIPDFELEWNFKKYCEVADKAQKASKVAEYVCTMQKEYQKELEQETLVLSNDDILYRAEKLLIDNPVILDRLRSKYKKIYVDEFQDTTGLQSGIVKMLSEKAGTKPEKVDLEAGKLLVVGDPKQSIYRFTGAEKAVYDAVDSMMNSLPNEIAESVSLSTNFRSNKTIVDWVNGAFQKLMPSGYSPMETDWEVAETNALHGVFQYLPDPVMGANGKTKKYDKGADIEEVARLVQRLVGKEYCFVEEISRKPDGSLKTREFRPIQNSDIMIICKNTTHMSGYVKRFAELGIPVNVQGKFKISDDTVLKNYVLLLEYFAGSKNQQKELTAIQIVCGMDVIKAEPKEVESVREFLKNMRQKFRKNNMDTAAIAEYLMAHEDLFLPKGSEQQPEAVRAYRIRLHQMVETCLLKNDGDIRKLADLMKDYLEKEVKREIPLESNENAIRLMNAHQSKGLTGQIVIIADRSAKEECRYGAFKKEGKYYPSVSYKSSEESASSYFPSYGADLTLMKQVYNEETEEAIRLQYVASTRAAQALIIMPVIAGTPWFTRPEYGYDSLPDANEWLKCREADTSKYTLKTSAGIESHPIQTLADLEKNLNAADITAMSEAQITSITPSSLEPAGVTGYGPSDNGYTKENRPSGNVFGTVMHRVYELIIGRFTAIFAMTEDDRDKAISRIINQAVLEQMDEMSAEDKPQEFVDFLKAVMLDYLGKVVKPIMDAADEVYPEYTFSFYVPEDERGTFLKDFGRYFNLAKNEIKVASDRIWINGQADLVVKQKDGTIKVYDYKSDAMNGKPMAAFERSLAYKYEGQLALYTYAIGKAFGVKNVQTELVHLYR